MSLADYKEKILNRNPFSPPNNAPQITTGSSHSINRGEQWTLQLESKDSEGHRVNFEVVSDELPEGLRVRDGVLSWRPSENGVHELLVRATDDGWPQRSTEQRIKLAVVDPPPVEVKVETPTFDVASQAFVSAILSGKSGPEAWIRSRTDGNTLYLSKGADFELGSIKAKVVDINLNEDFVEFETDGARWTIGMDDSLADAYKKSQVD